MDKVLCDLHLCYAYIDDILAASENDEEHFRPLEILFNKLQEYGLLINSSKCHYGKSAVQFLGYLVSGENTQALSDKVNAIVNYPQPEPRS